MSRARRPPTPTPPTPTVDESVSTRKCKIKMRAWFFIENRKAKQNQWSVKSKWNHGQTISDVAQLTSLPAVAACSRRCIYSCIFSSCDHAQRPSNLRSRRREGQQRATCVLCCCCCASSSFPPPCCCCFICHSRKLLLLLLLALCLANFR